MFSSVMPTVCTQMTTIFTDRVEHVTITLLSRWSPTPKILTVKWCHSSTRRCFTSVGQRRAIEASLVHSQTSYSAAELRSTAATSMV